MKKLIFPLTISPEGAETIVRIFIFLTKPANEYRLLLFPEFRPTVRLFTCLQM